MVIFSDSGMYLLLAALIFLIALVFPLYLIYILFRRYILKTQYRVNEVLLEVTGLCCLFFLFLVIPENLAKDPMECFAKCQKNMKRIGNALELYHLEHNVYPENLDQLTQGYLPEFPNCPRLPQITCVKIPLLEYRAVGEYRQNYEVYNDENPKMSRFTLYCRGENHRYAVKEGNYPKYSSRDGDITGAVTRKKRKTIIGE
jgi:hypothetical protein